VKVRVLAPLAAVAAAAGILVPASTAKAPPAAYARAAVVSGTLGEVAQVTASGDEDASRSAPSKTPKGIGLGGGSASASASKGGGDASASASAEARDVDLLGGAVTADSVTRSAQNGGKGTTYDGAVRGLAIGDRRIGAVSSGKRYDLPENVGYVVVNTGGAGLLVQLTQALDGYPAGTRVAVADVEASAHDGSATPTPTATPTATATATAAPTATPKPRTNKPPSYKKRLMSSRFEFPVRGKTRIGGPFGAFRADTGFHEGNDLFADFGTPVVAVADGTVENVGSLKISGNRLWVYADSGDQFFYAHLSAFSPEAVDHRHVRAGTLLGYVGNTGDAEPTPPHVHFEIHPDGGKAVDPNPFLVAWLKRAGDVSSDTAERPGALVEVRDFIGDG
jgi:murein DD-endopeptidase MepM/ murein hydrolase activator NlpD